MKSSTTSSPQRGENSNPLAVFLRANDITLVNFGVRLGRAVNPNGRAIPPSTISYYTRPLSDPRFFLPSRRRLEAIRDITKGAVAPADFFPTPKRRRAA